MALKTQSPSTPANVPRAVHAQIPFTVAPTSEATLARRGDGPEAPKVGPARPISGGSDGDDAALEADRHCMGSIAGA
jgi:hypothetical protein